MAGLEKQYWYTSTSGRGRVMYRIARPSVAETRLGQGRDDSGGP